MVTVPLWLLCPFLHRANIPQTMLLVATGNNLYYTHLTTTLLHCNTTTLQHFYTTTLLHHYTATLLHYNKTTLQHFYTTTLQHYYTTTLHRYQATTLLHCIGTLYTLFCYRNTVYCILSVLIQEHCILYYTILYYIQEHCILYYTIYRNTVYYTIL